MNKKTNRKIKWIFGNSIVVVVLVIILYALIEQTSIENKVLAVSVLTSFIVLLTIAVNYAYKILVLR